MKPSEKRKEIQKILGVDQDSKFGALTRAAFEALGREKDPPIAFDGTLTLELMGEYDRLFESMSVRGEVFQQKERIVETAQQHKSRYLFVQDQTAVPWYVIAAIHSLESSQSFSRHLHNGDPLTSRTVRVPAGRPKTGSPPFSWETSAIDALEYEELDDKPSWTLAETLFRMERYNGFGYRKFYPHILSPYLWAGSNHYTKGKYAKDGNFDPNLVSQQIGAAIILRELM